MSNQYFNFNYDPAKQGFDTDTWSKVYGDVTINGGQLELTRALIIHYGDILRGDATFSINLGAPTVEGNSRFGFIQYNKNEYACFSIDGLVLTAQTSDGVTSYSEAIPWDSAWTDVDTQFRIKWEAGAVRFYVAGNLMVTIDTLNTLDIPVKAVPNDPMSLFVQSDSLDLFLLDYISVVGIQSYLMSTGNSNSTFGIIVNESDRIHVSENVTMLMKILIAGEGIISDNLTVSESLTMFTNKIYPNGDGNVTQNISVTDVPTVTII